MNLSSIQEEGQLLGSVQRDNNTHFKSVRKNVIYQNQLTHRPARQPGDNSDIVKSICFVTIFALIALGVLFYVIQQSASNQMQLYKTQDIKKSKTLKTIAKQQISLSKNVKQTQQQNHNENKQVEEDSFTIELQQKPKPSEQQKHLQVSSPTQNNVEQQNPWLESQKDSPIKDKYFFKVPVQKFIQLSSPDRFFGKNPSKEMSGMIFDQLQFALNLLYVTHNINYQGQVVVQMAPYETNREQKQKWVKKIIETEKKIYEQKYEISQYMEQQLPFCIVTPSYNNVQSKLYLRNLDSIFMQQYQNYHVVYIDDASPDKTGKFVERYVKERRIPKDKIKVIINEKNVYALENIYNAIHNHCRPGEIVMLIDGDDALIGRQVFSLYNAIYQRTESAFVYSNYLHVMYNQKAVIGASSRPIPFQLLQRHGGIRNEKAFFTSHLLSFYVDLFRQIKKQDLTYENGTFYKYAYDVAMCTPMLQMIGNRVFYLPQLTYQYRYDTGINDPGSGQIQVTSLVFDKPAYDELKQLPYIDDRQNYLKKLNTKQKL